MAKIRLGLEVDPKNESAVRELSVALEAVEEGGR